MQVEIEKQKDRKGEKEKENGGPVAQGCKRSNEAPSDVNKSLDGCIDPG